jgi:hydrogenase/urease accessory protein HupE
MNVPMWLRICFALWLIGGSTCASAHPAPFSYLDLLLEPRAARGSIVLHDFDVAHELGLARPDALRVPEAAGRQRDALVRLLETRLQLRADGAAVTFRWGEIEVLAARQSLRLPFTVEPPVRGRLDIEAWLFPYDATHQTFVNIYEGGTLERQAILDARHDTLTFYRGSLQARWAVVAAFAQSGVQHILLGPDHVLFLIGLLLLGGSWWRLASIVTAFTAGHSVTLSLAALGLVQLAPRIVEPVIALSIIVIGVDTLLVQRQRRSARPGDARDVRPWLAAIFGLIHGFGFAAVLIELGLPREALSWSLAAFNIGVEIGQLCIVLLAIGVGHAALQVAAVRVWSERFLMLAAVVVITAGLYWLILRLGFVSAWSSWTS